MIRNRKLLEEFEREQAKRERLSVKEKFEIFNQMVEYVRSLGLWPPKDPLEGIEKDIKLAEVLRRYGESVKENSQGT